MLASSFHFCHEYKYTNIHIIIMRWNKTSSMLLLVGLLQTLRLSYLTVYPNSDLSTQILNLIL
jgi:hypothetical protein